MYLLLTPVQASRISKAFLAADMAHTAEVRLLALGLFMSNTTSKVSTQ